MPQAICYISNAPTLLDESELHNLFDYTVEANLKKNITGILTYKDGTFLQLLEGNNHEISTLFEKICKDNRHNNITKMIDRPIDYSIFQEYRTGFTSVFRDNQIEDLNLFIESSENSAYARSFKAFLKPFVLIHA